MNEPIETPYGKEYKAYFDEQKGCWNFRLKGIPQRKATKWMSQLDIHEGACYAGKRGEGDLGRYVRKVKRIINHGVGCGKFVSYATIWTSGHVPLVVFARWARAKVQEPEFMAGR